MNWISALASKNTEISGDVPYDEDLFGVRSERGDRLDILEYWLDKEFWNFDRGYQIVLTDDIKCKNKLVAPLECKDREHGDRWQDSFDETIRIIIEAPASKRGYDIPVPMERIRQGVGAAGRVNKFHPIREYLLDCAESAEEGADIDTMLIDYFGAEDNAYTRQVSRMIMIASVARVFQPGCKFGFAVILVD